MVWLYVIGYIVMGVVAVSGEVYMAKNYYSEKYRNQLKNDSGEAAAMVIGCMILWWGVIPFHMIRILVARVQKELQ